MPGDPRHYAQLLISLVPAEIRKSISADELTDRVIEGERLSRQAADPALSAAQREAARARARQVMLAAPRSVTEERVADKVAKAAALGSCPQADALRRQAQQLLEKDPPAPRRAESVRKAAAAEEDPVPVFDAAGNLVGVILDPSDLTPVSGARKAPAAAQPQDGVPPQDTVPASAIGQQVAKSGQVVVYDQHNRPYLASRHSVVTRVRIAKETSAEVNERFKRKASGKKRPGDDDGDDSGHGGVEPPEVQARRGSLGGGTTGLGPKRKDDKQKPLPGDVPGRTVIKAGWVPVHDWRGVLVGTVRKSAIVARPAGSRVQVAKSEMGRTHANIYNSGKRLVGMAPVSAIVPLTAEQRAARRRRS